MPLKENGQAQIKFTELAQDTLGCIIEDNGVGRAKSYEKKSNKQLIKVNPLILPLRDCS